MRLGAFVVRHDVCGTEILPELREVIAQPNERQWPKDRMIVVPFCPTCKILVTLPALDVTERI